MIKSILYNRTPDLTVKYPRPVNQIDFLNDSINIKLQIDSLIAKKNKDFGGPDRLYALIDTIIYSQTGDQVFVSYINKFEPNNLGNDFDPSFLSANKKNDKFWDLRECPPKAPNLGGSFHDIQTLKLEVRKYYFNQYLFADKDSNKVNYFWIKK
jgi:hypothetical protein